MITNIYNFFRAFNTFLYKIGGHNRRFVVKLRACSSRVTGLVGDGPSVITLKETKELQEMELHTLLTNSER